MHCSTSSATNRELSVTKKVFLLRLLFILWFTLTYELTTVVGIVFRMHKPSQSMESFRSNERYRRKQLFESYSLVNSMSITDNNNNTIEEAFDDYSSDINVEDSLSQIICTTIDNQGEVDVSDTDYSEKKDSLPQTCRSENSYSKQCFGSSNPDKSHLEYNNSHTNKVTKKAVVTITATAGAASAVSKQKLSLSYLQTMAAGAVSRTMAQTLMHPANTYKTMLQLKDRGTASTARALPAHSVSAKEILVNSRHQATTSFPQKLTKATLGIKNDVAHSISFQRLMKGVDAQFFLSLPHGAFHFFVIDQVKAKLAKFVPSKFDFLSDFSSSAISTIICSVVSTPQMVLTDRLMANIYPSFPAAISTIMKDEGVRGFYTGWWPALAQKIPSYGLTWMFFQQLKRSFKKMADRKPNSQENFILGAVAAAGSVCVMIPMDTVKTRLVTQCPVSGAGYKGVTDCFVRILKEEGVGSFYRSLPPRLVSVVPMIAIQYSVYEAMKAHFLAQRARESLRLEVFPKIENKINILAR